MPCKVNPAFPAPPSPPSGVSFPAFSLPSASAGFCCAISTDILASVLPDLPLSLFPDPTAIEAITAYLATVEGAIAEVFDAVAIPCPIE